MRLQLIELNLVSRGVASRFRCAGATKTRILVEEWSHPLGFKAVLVSLMPQQKREAAR